jgi:hypothetical protein
VGHIKKYKEIHIKIDMQRGPMFIFPILLLRTVAYVDVIENDIEIRVSHLGTDSNFTAKNNCPFIPRDDLVAVKVE